MSTSSMPIHVNEALTRVGFFEARDAVALVNECDTVIAQWEHYGLSGTPPDLRHREIRREAIQTVERWLTEVAR